MEATLVYCIRGTDRHVTHLEYGVIGSREYATVTEENGEATTVLVGRIQQFTEQAGFEIHEEHSFALLSRVAVLLATRDNQTRAGFGEPCHLPAITQVEHTAIARMLAEEERLSPLALVTKVALTCTESLRSAT